MNRPISLPPRMWAVFVAGKVIALFSDEMEGSAYMRVLRGPESEMLLVTWDHARG